MSATRNAAAACGALAVVLCAATAGAADDPADGAAVIPIQNAQDRVQNLQDVQRMTEQKDHAGREHAGRRPQPTAQQGEKKRSEFERPERPDHPDR